MWKKILTMSLVLVMALPFTACAKEPSGEEIINGVRESFDNIKTYQFDTDQTIDMTSDEGDMSFALRGSCIVDVENRRVRQDTTIEEISETGQHELAWGGEEYFIDGILYVKPKVTGEDPAWIKEEAPEEWWEMTHQEGLVMSQIELLETAQVDVVGSESIDGIDCYVLDVIPDLELLWQLHARLTFQEAPDVTEEYLQEIFHSFSVKQWIAKDTYFLVKAEIDMSTEFPPETPGPSKTKIAMVLLSYNYNEPVSIVLPPEAEETIKVGIEDTTWVLVSYGEEQNPQVVLEGSEITALFSKAQDTIDGSAGCNTYHANYEFNNDELSISAIQHTERYCDVPQGVMEQEQQYLALLEAAENFQVRVDYLVIFCSGGRALVFRAQ